MDGVETIRTCKKQRREWRTKTLVSPMPYYRSLRFEWALKQKTLKLMIKWKVPNSGGISMVTSDTKTTSEIHRQKDDVILDTSNKQEARRRSVRNHYAEKLK